jgi:putative transcriptional regulator
MKKALFEELLESVNEGGEILQARRPASRAFEVQPSELRELRERFGLTQARFSALMGISVSTLRNWEQGRRRPEGSARVLLRVVAERPDAVMEVVFGAITKNAAGRRRRAG